MKISGGELKGRTIDTPPGRAVRPTGAMTREAMFNLVMHDPAVELVDGRVADAFAGSGALGFEALSRGAAHCTFIEQDRQSLKILEGNIDALGVRDRCTVLKADATRPPDAATPCTALFLDPPYMSELSDPALVALARHGWLAHGAVAVLEHPAKKAFTPPPGFELVTDRRYGTAAVCVMRWMG